MDSFTVPISVNSNIAFVFRVCDTHCHRSRQRCVNEYGPSAWAVLEVLWT
jgi:hypothetical protein